MATPLKDFVGRDVVRRLGARMQAVEPDFDLEGFVGAASASLRDLELKARIAMIARRLGAALPHRFPAAVAAVVRAARHPDPPIGAWEAWPLNAFVEQYGIGHPRESLDALEVLTRFASSEFALRPFLEQHPEATWSRVEEWAGHGDEAVRRLASEGTRPLLPWGKRVAALRRDPERGLAILERLRDDPSPTVRRSVANHLNDISKDHPDLAVATARRWSEDASPDTMALLNRGLRTLVKQGHEGALEVLGFTTDPEVEVELRCSEERIAVGDTVRLEAMLRSTGSVPQLLVVDYVVHYLRGDGSSAGRVFKWRSVELAPGEAATLRRRHCFQDMSTRTHHPGRHRIGLQVAGRVLAEVAFDLEPA